MEEENKKSKVPVICLIIGIFSIIISDTPFCMFFALVGGAIGLLLIISDKNTPKSVAGFVLCIIAITLRLFIFGSVGSGSDEIGEQKSKEATTEESNNPTEKVDVDALLDEYNSKNDSDKKDLTEEELKEKEEAEKKAKKEAKKKEKAKKEKQEKKFRESCKEYKYKDVLRNPDNYVGEKVKIEVKISSVHNESWMNSGKYYFARSREDSEDEYYWDDEYAIIDTRENTKKPKLLEDDVIMVYGTIAEPEETKSLILNSEELFCIDMKYVDLLAE